MGALDSLVAPQENTKKAPSQLPAKKSSSLDDLLSARRPVAELPQNVVQPPQPSMTFPVDSSKGQVTRGLPGPRLSTLAASRSPLVVPQAPNAPMVFSVGEGLNNRTDVLPGPRLSTLDALKRGEKINVTPAPTQTSQVTQANRAVGVEPVAGQKPESAGRARQIFLKGNDMLGEVLDPNKNLPAKLLQKPTGKALQYGGYAIGGVVGGLGNLITSVMAGHPAADTPEHTAAFMKDVIDTARSTGEFGRQIGEQGAAMATLGFPAEIGGVFATAGEAINALAMVPQIAGVYSDIQTGNITPETGINAGMALLFGLSAGKPLPEFARSLRSKASVNDIAGSAADVLGIARQTDALGRMKRVPKSVIEEAYQSKLANGVKDPFQLEIAKSVLQDHATLPTKQFTARYQEPLLQIADMIDEAAAKPSQTPQEAPGATPSMSQAAEAVSTIAPQSEPFKGLAEKIQNTTKTVAKDAVIGKESVVPKVEAAAPIKITFDEASPLHNRVMGELVGAEAGKRIANQNTGASPSGGAVPSMGEPVQAPAPEAVQAPVEAAVEAVAKAGKASKVGKSIEAKSIERGLSDTFPDTAQYDPVTIKEQAQKAADLINNDFERAKRIVLGQERLPDGLLGGTIIKAMEDYAMKNGDAELALQIAKSPLTAETSIHAQEMRMLAERNPDSAVANIQKLERIKRETAKKKGASVEDVVQDIRKSIARTKKTRATKVTWAEFVDTITC